MEKQVELIYAEDTSTGEYSWFLKSVYDQSASEDMYSGSNGAGIAHDLLEHPNEYPDLGNLADEICAIGGFMFGRYSANRVNENNRYGYNYPGIRSDLSGLLEREVIQEGNKIDVTGYDFSNNDPEIELQVKQELLKFEYTKAKDMVRDALEHGEYDYEEDKEQLKQTYRDFMRLTPKLVAYGHEIACNKWDGQDYSMAELFWNIAKAVNNAEPIEGMEYTLIYNTESLEASISYEDEWEEEEEDAA